MPAPISLNMVESKFLWSFVRTNVKEFLILCVHASAFASSFVSRNVFRMRRPNYGARWKWSRQKTLKFVKEAKRQPGLQPQEEVSKSTIKIPRHRNLHFKNLWKGNQADGDQPGSKERQSWTENRNLPGLGWKRTAQKTRKQQKVRHETHPGRVSNAGVWVLFRTVCSRADCSKESPFWYI